MKIALLGSKGQLGWELQRTLAVLGEVVCPGRETAAGNLADPSALVAALQALRPDVIVNAAAYTAVDRAESEPALAHTVNADAPAALARLAAASGAWLLHYSTDYVFDGTGSAPRTEDSPTGPLSVYGRTKLAGEAAVRAAGCRHLIFRTSWVHGARGGNFARTMLRLAADRPQLTVIDDQIGAPTGADLLADISAHALRMAWAQPDLAGTYHAVAAGEVSWCGYARHVLAWAEARGVALKAGPQAVQPIPTSDYPTPARRPLNSRLDTSRLRQAFGLTLPDWRSGVDRMLSIALNLPAQV